MDGRKLKLGFIGLGQATSKVMARLDEIRTLSYIISWSTPDNESSF